MRRVLLIAAGLILVLLAAFVAWQTLRPPARATSAVDPDVTIVCSASSGVDEAACATWGDGILAAGPPSTTFEMVDLVRLELSKAFVGFGFGECEAEYFLGRYPDSAVWTETVDCR